MSSLITEAAPAPTHEAIDALRRVAVFGALSARAQRELEAHVTLRTHRRNTRIWDRGEASREVLAVLSGRIQCSVPGHNGRGWVRAIHRSVETCGLSSLIDGGPYICTVTALERARVLHVDAEPLRAMIDHEPRFVLAVTRAVTQDLRKAVGQCSHLVLRTPLERLAGFLLEHADGSGNARLRDTQGQIAAQIGTVREVVGRAFRRLEEDGVVVRRGRMVSVLDRDALVRLAR